MNYTFSPRPAKSPRICALIQTGVRAIVRLLSACAFKLIAYTTSLVSGIALVGRRS